MLICCADKAFTERKKLVYTLCINQVCFLGTALPFMAMLESVMLQILHSYSLGVPSVSFFLLHMKFSYDCSLFHFYYTNY